MKKILIISFTLIIVISIFFFVRSLYCVDWFKSFEYDKSVSPVDVFNLTISSLVAISLGYYITKKLTEERFMKEYLISDIKAVEAELENIETILNANSVDLSTAFNVLNKLNHKIERIENTAKLMEFKSNELLKLKTLSYKLFEVATTTDDSEKINTFQIDMKLEPIYNDLSKSLRKMVYSVNKI